MDERLEYHNRVFERIPKVRQCNIVNLVPQ